MSERPSSGFLTWSRIRSSYITSRAKAYLCERTRCGRTQVPLTPLPPALPTALTVRHCQGTSRERRSVSAPTWPYCPFVNQALAVVSGCGPSVTHTPCDGYWALSISAV